MRTRKSSKERIMDRSDGGHAHERFACHHGQDRGLHGDLLGLGLAGSQWSLAA